MTDNDDANRRIFSQPPAVPYADATTQLKASIATLVAGCNSHTKRIEALEKTFTGDWLRRIEELERRMLTEAEHKSIYSAIERIEALEAWNREGGVLYNMGTKLSDLDDELPVGLRDRLVALEDAEAESQEDQRQARWHATFNAAYPYVDTEPYDTVDIRIENSHVIATRAADRAHGPLEAVVVGPPMKPRPPDPTPEMLKTPEFNAVWNVIKGWDVDHGGGMRSGATGNDARAILDALGAPKVDPKAYYPVEPVEALVKSVQVVLKRADDYELNGALTATGKALSHAVEALRVAAKPFESA